MMSLAFVPADPLVYRNGFNHPEESGSQGKVSEKSRVKSPRGGFPFEIKWSFRSETTLAKVGELALVPPTDRCRPPTIT